MYNQSTLTYCAHNATNASKVVCIMNNQSNYQIPEYLPEYSMDISIFSYMYTLFLAFGCYSILNPVSARIYTLKTIVGLANYSIIGYGLFKEHMYKPYMKYVYPNLLRLLQIDDGINEIVVVKNGKIIYRFKTMELFVKNNPIKFVKEFSDDDIEEEKKEEEQRQKEECTNQENVNSTSDLSDKVDYNKKCELLNELIEAFKIHSLDDKPSNTEQDSILELAPAVDESDESDNTEDTDKTHEDSDNIPNDYILDPTAYDFIIRNFYYNDEKTGETYSYVFKYDLFYKSEMNEKYDVNMVKDKYISNRKFIGISLKTNDQKYTINLTTPNNYYVSDNSILNYSFMKWYMMEHYYVKLSHDYVISCIDNYVEMYKINPGKKIFVHKNRFELVYDETFVNDDNDNDNDNDIDEETDEETDEEIDSESDDSETEGKSSSIQAKNDSIKIINMNLEETHEMCDIEILEYD